MPNLRNTLDLKGTDIPLVDKRIGNAYPAVKAVSEKLDILTYLAANLHNIQPRDVELRGNNVDKQIEWRYVGEPDDSWMKLLGYGEIPGIDVEEAMAELLAIQQAVRQDASQVRIQHDNVVLLTQQAIQAAAAAASSSSSANAASLAAGQAKTAAEISATTAYQEAERAKSYADSAAGDSGLRAELSTSVENYPVQSFWAPVAKTQLAGNAALSQQAQQLTNRTQFLLQQDSANLAEAKAYADSVSGGGANKYVQENPIINGGFDVWSLGSSVTLSTHLQRICDGWNYDWNGSLGGGSIAVQQISPTLYQPGFSPRYGARVRQTVAGSGTTFRDFSTHIEGARTFAGEQVTISFWAISNSGSSVTMTAVKTEQYFGSGGAPSAPKFNTSAPIIIGTSWQRYSVTFNMAALTGVIMGNNADDTLNVILTLPLNQTFDITFANVQINRGSQAAPFEYSDPAVITARCRRRIFSSYEDQTRPGTATKSGVVAFIATHANMLYTINIPNGMRSVPHTALYNPQTGAANTWNNQGTPVSVATNTVGQRNVTIAVNGCTPGTFVEGHFFLSDPQM